MTESFNGADWPKADMAESNRSSLRGRLDDLNEVWLEGGTAHQKTVNVLGTAQLCTVLGCDRPSIDQPRGL